MEHICVCVKNTQPVNLKRSECKNDVPTLQSRWEYKITHLTVIGSSVLNGVRRAGRPPAHPDHHVPKNKLPAQFGRNGQTDRHHTRENGGRYVNPFMRTRNFNISVIPFGRKYRTSNQIHPQHQSTWTVESIPGLCTRRSHCSSDANRVLLRNRVIKRLFGFVSSPPRPTCPLCFCRVVQLTICREAQCCERQHITDAFLGHIAELIRKLKSWKICVY